MAVSARTVLEGNGNVPSDVEPQGLRTKVVGGLRWKLLSQVVGLASQLVVGIVLAHLLTPREFGLAAMALVFGALTTIFTDLSLGAALVQRPEITEQDRSTVFWTSVGAGMVVTAIWVGVSPLVGDFFHNSAVVPLFAATGLSALLWGVASTQMALLTRALDFRSMELREIGAKLIGGAVAIALALTGAGAWAIVSQYVVVAAASAILVWGLSGWRPQLTYSRESLRTLGSFGAKTLFARLLSYSNSYMDNLLVGRFLGTVPLGVYSIAYSVMYMPTTRVSAPIQQVLFPAFARLQHDFKALGRSWIRGMELVGAVNAPACLGMAVVAPDFVPVVFGHRWIAAVPVLQLLCLAGAAESLKTLNWSVLQAVGDSGRLLRFMIFSTLVTVGAFVAGLHWGVVGVAGLFAVARALVAGSFGWLTSRRIGQPVSDFVRGVARVAGLVLPMAVVVYLLRLALVSAGVPAAARLALLVVIGAGFYVWLVRWRAPDLLREVTGLLLPRLNRIRPRRPQTVDEGCLTPALRTLARRSPLAVQLDARPLPDVPDQLEILTYYLVAEALTNAAEHARASLVTIRLEERGGMLELAVGDDGRGGARIRPGSSLSRFSDSVEYLGGTFSLTSPSGEGTVVSISVPLASRAQEAASASTESDGPLRGSTLTRRA